MNPLLDKDLETNNETTAVSMQRRSKRASTAIEWLLETMLCNPLLGSCNSWTTTMEIWVISVWYCGGVILSTELVVSSVGKSYVWEAVRIEPERVKLKILHY
jgi:hypothetical protein